MSALFSQSGFGSLEPVRYITKEVGVVVLNSALDFHDLLIAEKVWDKWAHGASIMAADQFGRMIFFFDHE